jgi:serine/threonine protein kinase
MSTIGKLNLDHLVGQQVGTAVLLKKIGHGAMSAVFAAFQKTLKRQIAVKVLPKSLLTEKTAAFFPAGSRIGGHSGPPPYHSRL